MYGGAYTSVIGRDKPPDRPKRKTEMTTQTADIMDLLGDAAKDFAEEQISAITAAVCEMEDRLTAKCGEMSDTDLADMMLTPTDAIIAVVADEAELTDYASDDDAFEAALIAASYMGASMIVIAADAGIDIDEAAKILGDLA
nr:MAG TPA: hypothetical protein [Caudoviricetes sp.]